VYVGRRELKALMPSINPKKLKPSKTKWPKSDMKGVKDGEEQNENDADNEEEEDELLLKPGNVWP
jgi:hypothetical protein